MLSKEDGRSVNVAGDGTARTSWNMAVKSRALVATIAAEFLNRMGLCSCTPSEATYGLASVLERSYSARKKLPVIIGRLQLLGSKAEVETGIRSVRVRRQEPHSPAELYISSVTSHYSPDEVSYKSSCNVDESWLNLPSHALILPPAFLVSLREFQYRERQCCSKLASPNIADKSLFNSKHLAWHFSSSIPCDLQMSWVKH